MKKFITILLLLSLSLTCSCASNMLVDGKLYKQYGLFNQHVQDDEVEYEFVWGNLVWSFVFVETIVAPVYFCGFSLWQPVGMKPVYLGDYHVLLFYY